MSLTEWFLTLNMLARKHLARRVDVASHAVAVFLMPLPAYGLQHAFVGAVTGWDWVKIGFATLVILVWYAITQFAVVSILNTVTES